MALKMNLTLAASSDSLMAVVLGGMARMQSVQDSRPLCTATFVGELTFDFKDCKIKDF